MRIKLARVGVFLASVLSLLGFMTTPAEAVQVGTVAFYVDAYLAPGSLGYPCTTTDILTLNVPGCLLTAVGGVTPGTKTKLGVPQPQFTMASGNTAGFISASIACVGLKLSVLVPSKDIAQLGAGTCAFGAGGTVTGYCGLSSGAGTGAITIDTTVSVPSAVVGQKTTPFTFKFWGVGGTLVVDGTYGAAGAKTGVLNGIVEAIPDTPLQSSTTCTNKSGIHFTILGAATLIGL